MSSSDGDLSYYEIAARTLSLDNNGPFEFPVVGPLEALPRFFRVSAVVFGGALLGFVTGALDVLNALTELFVLTPLQMMMETLTTLVTSFELVTQDAFEVAWETATTYLSGFGLFAPIVAIVVVAAVSWVAAQVYLRFREGSA